MTRGHNATVGLAAAVLVVATMLIGGYLMLTGNSGAVDGGAVETTEGEGGTTRIGDMTAAGDLATFSQSDSSRTEDAESADSGWSSDDADGNQPDGSDRPALRVVTEPAGTKSPVGGNAAPNASTTPASPPVAASAVADSETAAPVSPSSDDGDDDDDDDDGDGDDSNADSGSTSTTAPKPPAVTGDARSFEQQVITLTNEARAANDCPPLTHNDKLHAAALAHSVDMHDKGYFSHTSQDGSTMANRIDRQGYPWRMLAENIAEGYRTPSAVVDGWMNSSGHRANILNCKLKEIGVGFHNYYWTQNFGTAR